MVSLDRTNLGVKRPPLKSFRDLMDDFNISRKDLMALLHWKNGPPPIYKHKQNSYYCEKEMKKWWVSLDKSA